jgi:hypothetical protein
MLRWLALALAFLAPESPRLSYAVDAYNVTIAGDSLKFALFWTQPADSLGRADSTVYVAHVSKATRFYSDTVTRAAGARIRRRFLGATADSFKLKRPAYGDSVVVTGDTIFQCRGGACSVPGSFAVTYVRRSVPPPMTIVRIVQDSF